MPDAIIEYGFTEGVYHKQYERLREELERGGYVVELRRSLEVEERSAGAFPQGVWDVTVRVLGFTEEHPLIPVLIAASMKHLRGRVKFGRRKGQRRVETILDARGRPWREVELPDEDD